MTLSDMGTKKPAYLFLTRLWRFPVIDVWSRGSHLSQLLGIFASFSVFGFGVSSPPEQREEAASVSAGQEAHGDPSSGTPSP